MGIKDLYATIRKHAPGAITSVAHAQLRDARVAVDFGLQIHRVAKGGAMRDRGFEFGDPQHVEAVAGALHAIGRSFGRVVWVVDHPGASEAKRFEHARRAKTAARSVELQAEHEAEADRPVDLPRARSAKRAREADQPGEDEPALLDLERALGAKLCAAVLEDQLSLVAAQDQRRSDLAWARFQKSSVRPEFLAAVRAELTRLGQDSLMAPPGVEAEQLAARMQARGTFDYVMSEDMDTLAFGAPRLLCKQRAEGFDCIELAAVLSGLGFDMREFVDMCILSGSDFTANTIPGVGPVRAHALMTQHRTIEAVLAARGVDSVEGFDHVAARAQFALAISDDVLSMLDAAPSPDTSPDVSARDAPCEAVACDAPCEAVACDEARADDEMRRDQATPEPGEPTV